MADTIVVNEIVDSIVIAVGGEQGPPGITDFNPALSFVGDVTGSGTTGQAVTTSLANTQVASGSYGSPSKTVTFTVDSKGRLQAAGESVILLDALSVISGVFQTDRMPAFSGDASTVAGNTVLTLASTGVNAGSYTKVTVDEKGRVIGGTNPATLGTMGIIDAYTKAEVDAAVSSATPSFETLTGKPSTLAGYGIIDGVSTTQFGVSIATLGNNGKVPPSQLPSYIDTVVEYPLASSFPSTGVSGTIYIDTSTKNSYRWSGTGYVNVGTAGGSVSMDFINILGKPTTLSGYGILDAVNSVLVGANSGLATLGPNGKLTTSQMPAAVDQIQEIGTFNDLPVNGLTSTIYLVLDTNKIYRFSGSAYVEISSAGTSDDTLKLHTARTIGMTGDVTWTSGVFDGSANVTGVSSLKTSGVTAGTYTKVIVNDKGIVTSASMPTTLADLGVTNGVITSDVGTNVAPLVGGKVPSVNLPSYVDDVLEFATLADFPTQGEAGKIYIATTTNLSYRWATSVYVQISSAGGVVSVAALNITTNGNDVSSTVANQTTAPVITLNLPTANATSRGALSATDWSTFNAKQAALVSGTSIKTINGTSLLGSGDIVITAGAGSFADLTGKPTTISGYGITNAYTKTEIDTSLGLKANSATTYTKTEVDTAISNATPSFATLTGKPTTISGYGITDAQAVLVSGTNIKTINGTSILGSGDIVISGGGGGSGTVTLVSGTAPITVTNGGTTPTISISQASSTVNGYLSSTDWSTFNGKQAALGFTPYNATNPSGYTSNLGTVTSVSGTGTVSGLTLTGSVTSSGSLTLGGTLAVSLESISGFGSGVSTFLATPSSANLLASMSDETGSGLLVFGTTPTITGLREVSAALAANNIDVASGNYFTKTITGATTFTVSNVPTTATVASFVLELTNGGSSAITWWAGVKWASGTAPVLTTAGRDLLGFITKDGGTTWDGLVMSKDQK